MTTPATMTPAQATSPKMYQPCLTASWKASTPHSTEMSGSERVRPGCAAISCPAFIAAWVRKNPSTPAATIV